jgi:hypothetical protein
MSFFQSSVSEQLDQAFTVYIPAALRQELEGLEADERHVLLDELFRVATQAGRERRLLPRQGPVTLQFLLSGRDVTLELDAARARLTLVALRHGPH